MPSRSLRPCTYPGCDTLVTGGRCADHSTKAVERNPEVKSLYNSRQWRMIREMELMLNPWCVCCMAKGYHVEATEVHHKVPHRGDRVKFFEGPFECLCKSCHSSETAKEVGWHD